jgi:hypothetical protein
MAVLKSEVFDRVVVVTIVVVIVIAFGVVAWSEKLEFEVFWDVGVAEERERVG